MDVGDPTTDNLELMEHLALHYGTFDAVASGDDAVCGSDFVSAIIPGFPHLADDSS